MLWQTHPLTQLAPPPPFFKIFVFSPLLSVPPFLKYFRQFPPPMQIPFALILPTNLFFVWTYDKYQTGKCTSSTVGFYQNSVLIF